MNVLELGVGYYQVTAKGRWWTAMQTTSGWNIQNEAGRQLRADGALGVRLLAAIDEHEAGVR